MKSRGSVTNPLSLERTLQLGMSEELTRLERNMSVLATTAGVSPFIGLFGTVWGIIDAFQQLSTAGAASLRAVAPGISEALITTAMGLFAAIPAAYIFYNISAAPSRNSPRAWKTSARVPEPDRAQFREVNYGISP
jgi:biopolymer transport protein TolQ